MERGGAHTHARDEREVSTDGATSAEEHARARAGPLMRAVVAKEWQAKSLARYSGHRDISSFPGHVCDGIMMASQRYHLTLRWSTTTGGADQSWISLNASTRALQRGQYLAGWRLVAGGGAACENMGCGGGAVPGLGVVAWRRRA